MSEGSRYGVPKKTLARLKETESKPKILMTSHSDMNQHALEQLGGDDVHVIAHFNGLWYKDAKQISLTENYEDLASLAKIVKEEKTIVVVFSGCASQNLLFSTIQTGKFLIDNTCVRSVLLFQMKKLEQHHSELFSGSIFLLNELGLTHLVSYKKITGKDFFDEAIKLAKILNEK